MFLIMAIALKFYDRLHIFVYFPIQVKLKMENGRNWGIL